MSNRLIGGAMLLTGIASIPLLGDATVALFFGFMGIGLMITRYEDE